MIPPRPNTAATMPTTNDPVSWSDGESASCLLIASPMGMVKIARDRPSTVHVANRPKPASIGDPAPGAESADASGTAACPPGTVRTEEVRSAAG